MDPIMAQPQIPQLQVPQIQPPQPTGSIGAALQPNAIPGAPATAGPPATPEELASRTAGWHSFFTDPRTIAFLGQMGVNLGSSYSSNQTGFGHVLNSIAAGGNAAGKVDTEVDAQKQLDIKNAQAQQNIGIDQQHADAQTTQATTDANRAKEQKLQNEFERGDKFALEKQKEADTVKLQQETNKIAAGHLAVDSARLDQDAPYKIALANEADARAKQAGVEAKRYDENIAALANISFGGDPQAAKAWVLSAGILAKNTKGKPTSELILNNAVKLVTENAKARAVDSNIPALDLATAAQQAREALTAAGGGTTPTTATATPTTPTTPAASTTSYPVGAIIHNPHSNVYQQKNAKGAWETIPDPTGAK